MKSALVTMSRYAKMRGVSVEAVSKAAKAGRISLTGGKVDVARADEEWQANTRPGQKLLKRALSPVQGDAGTVQRLPSTGANSYAVARAKREELRLKLDQVDFDERMGILVDAAEFRDKFLPMIADAKTRLLGVASKCKARLPGLSAVDVSIIEDLIREALGEIANGKG